MSKNIFNILQFCALCLLMIVTGIFWGNYFSFSRSYEQFSCSELIHIATVIVNNLAMPMRFISMACMLCVGITVYLFPDKKTREFYWTMTSLLLLLVSLVITVVVEVPINEQIISWTPSTAPQDWEAIRNRWQSFNQIRTGTALASFALLAAAVAKPFRPS